MIRSYADPALVLSGIENAIGYSLTELFVLEIMRAHRFRFSYRLPFLSAIFEIANQFFLLRIHGDDRLPALLEILTLAIEILKLRIAVRMRCSFPGFLQRL